MKKKKPVFINGVLAFILIMIFFIALLGAIIAIEKNNPNKNMAELWKNILLGVLCSVIASIIFAIIARLYSRNDSDAVEERLMKIEKHLDRQDELYDCGINSIRPKSHFDQEDSYWNEIIENCKCRLDLVGHSLYNWFGIRYRDTFITKIVSIVNSQSTVNIVLSKSSPIIIDGMISNVKCAYCNENVKLSKLEKTLLELYTILKDIIPSKNRKYLRIYIIDTERVTYFYIRTDLQCIISPYTSSLGNRENIFLLDLNLETPHVKIMEDDFDEIINSTIPIDFQIKEEEKLSNSIWLDKELVSENNYKSKEWNREITHKYVFRDTEGFYEAGMFIHYNNTNYVKSVIELPVGFGCPAKCIYCASSCINKFVPLDSKKIYYIFEHLYLGNKLEQNDKIILTLTGMGDVFFNQENVIGFLKAIQKYNNIHLTVSSNFWTLKLYNKIISVNTTIPIHYIQYTYVSHKEGTREKLINVLSSLDDKDYLNEFIKVVNSTDKLHFRINYIVIKDINDSDDNVKGLISMVNEIKEKIVIRISKLNETKSTLLHSLCPSDNVRLGEINEMFKNAGFNSYVFYAEKNDNMNCGQLLTEGF